MNEMYFNNFDKKEVEKTLKKIKALKVPDLIILDERTEKGKFSTMSYIPYLHRLDVCDYDGKLLYPNPSCIVSMAPIDEFIKQLKPSAEYKMMMNAH